MWNHSTNWRHFTRRSAYRRKQRISPLCLSEISATLLILGRCPLNRGNNWPRNWGVHLLRHLPRLVWILLKHLKCWWMRLEDAGPWQRHPLPLLPLPPNQTPREKRRTTVLVSEWMHPLTVACLCNGKACFLLFQGLEYFWDLNNNITCGWMVGVDSTADVPSHFIQ